MAGPGGSKGKGSRELMGAVSVWKGERTLEMDSGVCVHAESLQSCLTLCDPMDWSLPGSSLHGILQARILERVAMPS